MSKYNELYEDTTEKMGQDYLAITSDSFHLMKAFKEACEEMGWKYNTSFTPFTKDKYDNMNKDRCLYFSFDFDCMEGKPAFAISHSQLPGLSLPTQWNTALSVAKKMLEAKRHLYSVELNEDYTAVVDTKKKVVRVGCQDIEFDKIIEVARIIEKNG